MSKPASPAEPQASTNGQTQLELDGCVYNDGTMCCSTTRSPPSLSSKSPSARPRFLAWTAQTVVKASIFFLASARSSSVPDFGLCAGSDQKVSSCLFASDLSALATKDCDQRHRSKYTILKEAAFILRVNKSSGSLEIPLDRSPRIGNHIS